MLFGFTVKEALWMVAASIIVVAIIYPEMFLELADQTVLPLVDRSAVDYLEWRGRSMTREEMHVEQATRPESD